MAAEQDAPRWVELTCDVPHDSTDAVIDQLVMLGYDQCWVETEIAHEPVPDGWRASPAGLTGQVRLCVGRDECSSPEDLVATLREQLGPLAHDIRWSELQAEDWLRGWRETRQVVDLGNGWCISPPWLTETVPDGVRTVVIDPGLAFGAGDHPTTRDTATLLLEVLQPGDRMLDVGAGSGVLSILAKLAGASEATALEIDELAATEIPRNAALNRVVGINVIVGDAADFSATGTYDLVAMNIGARASRMLRALCDAVTDPGARLVLSGIARWAAEACLGDFAIGGWKPLTERVSEGDWTTMALVREAS